MAQGAILTINPILPAVTWFRDLWDALPAPLHSLFYVSLALLVLWGIYRLLSR